MTHRLSREETIFHGAQQLAPDQRAPYLAMACGSDEPLRHRIEALLQAEAEANPFFGKDPVQAALGGNAQGTSTLVLPVTEKAGDRIGRYKLLQQIGEGGCGVVYMAEQEEPVRRRVALKVIKLGMDTKSVIARFEAERQALALMDHLNIAKVLDAGATETGRPYFVMELVRGIKITEYCDQNNFSTPERLGLFIQVCNAIQHAHQKGIIHRDIKPTNILVSLHDGVPVPVVIDFGIAKATEQRLTEKTLFTAFEQFIGTPAYTSPEQAEMSRLDIDTRSDIYSLGVLLYELLTGRTPFDSQELMEAGLDEMRRTIRDREPLRPSTRLATLQGDELTTTARRRSADAPKLIHLLKGDLDWIVMKCLEKDRSRRYETASALAIDIKHHLANEPVVARPPTAGYRLLKAWRRNKGGFAAGTIILVALVVGGAVSTWQAVRAEKARQAAVRERSKAELATQQAMANAQSAEDQKLRAEEATRLAKRQEAETRRRAYASDMNLAHEAVPMNNLRYASRLLDRYRPEKDLEDLRGWEWRYLWGRCQSEAMFSLCRLPESDGVISTAIRPGESWVAIGGESLGTGIEVWDVSTRRQVTQLAAGEKFAHVAFSPDGARLAFSTPGWLRLWDCATKTILVQRTVDGNIVSLAFSADGQRIATYESSTSKSVTLWQATRLEKLTSWPAPQGHAYSGTPFAVTPDLKTAVVVSGVDGIVVMDLESGEERWRTNSPFGWTSAIAISHDGARLATGFGQDNPSIQIWDSKSGAELARLPGHRAWISTLKFCPDGKTMISASADQTIRIWDFDRREPIRTLRGHRHEIASLDMTSDATMLASGGKDGAVLVWDTKRAPAGPGAWTLAGAHWGWHFSTDGRAIHAVERALDSPRRGWRWADGRAIQEQNPGRLVRYQGAAFEHREVLQEIPLNGDFLFSPSGRLFATAATDGLVRVWDLNERILAYEFPVKTTDFRPVAFSKDENRIWLLQGNGNERERTTLTEWNMRTRRQLRSIEGVRDGLLTLHADRWAFWVNPDGRCAFHDLRTGHTSHPQVATGRLRALKGFPSASADGDLLVIGHEFDVLTVWETSSLADGVVPRQVTGVSAAINGFSSFAFSPDRTRLVTAGHTTEAIQLWDTRTYYDVLTLQGSGLWFHDIGLSPDGKCLGALNAVGTIHLWRAPTWAEIEASEKNDQGGSGE